MIKVIIKGSFVFIVAILSADFFSWKFLPEDADWFQIKIYEHVVAINIICAYALLAIIKLSYSIDDINKKINDLKKGLK